jgi:hypothetical protein
MARLRHRWHKKVPQGPFFSPTFTWLASQAIYLLNAIIIEPVMPALNNQKHENFAQLTVHGAKYGWSQGEIYQRSGYRATGHSAAMAASRLMKKDDIRARIAELAAPKDVLRRVNVSAQALIDKSETLFERGVATDQLNAVGKAIELQGKLGGALVDRVEVGSPGEFAQLKTLEDVVAALLVDMEPGDLADFLRRMIAVVEEQMASRAITVTPPAARASEVDAALHLLRPGKKH